MAERSAQILTVSGRWNPQDLLMEGLVLGVGAVGKREDTEVSGLSSWRKEAPFTERGAAWGWGVKRLILNR